MIWFYILSAVSILGVMAGLVMMSKVNHAARGNLLSAASILLAILLILSYNGLLAEWYLWLCLLAGAGLGLLIAAKVKMIQMPQLVALLCAFGGASCSVVVGIALIEKHTVSIFDQATAAISLAIGVISLVGSLIAAGKLAGKIPQRPIRIRFHQPIVLISLGLTLVFWLWLGFFSGPTLLLVWLCVLAAAVFGVVFVLRVGGADMPITISLLISLGSVAGAIAGMAVNQILLVALEGIVGASGLLLTQIMCRAMNRSLKDILLGKTSVAPPTGADSPPAATEPETAANPPRDAAAILRAARDVIIIPGYGMALAQAQELVKELALGLEAGGARVRFAIHPVAGRMPGHMNVLLCEVDVPYDQLYELDDINDDFSRCDLALIVGANDVVNPAAHSAEGTPIYGMPVLNADQAAAVFVCNYDEKPGYAGVANPLYRADNTVMLLGDAKDTLSLLLSYLE